MANLTVSHKTFGRGQVESIEKKRKLDHTYITVRFEKDNSTRRFLIFDEVGKPIPFLKFFEKNEEVLSFFEDYKDFLFNQMKSSFPQNMVHETPIVPEVEEEDISNDKKEKNEDLKNNKIEDTVKENYTSTEEVVVNEKVEEKVEKATNKEISKEVVEDTPVKRGRGRPKGSVSKKTAVETPIKKSRGRPKGSGKK